MTAARAKSRKPECLLFRVARYGGDGVLLPADGYTSKRLRERRYQVGDVLLADLRKPRHPGFHRLAHRLGQLVAENIEAFEGLDGHTALKRIQIEAGVGCDEIPLRLPVIGQITYRVPRSLSYASMDQSEFEATVRRMCEHIAREYWPSMSAEQIEAMAQVMPEAT